LVGGDLLYLKFWVKLKENCTIYYTQEMEVKQQVLFKGLFSNFQQV